MNSSESEFLSLIRWLVQQNLDKVSLGTELTKSATQYSTVIGL